MHSVGAGFAESGPKTQAYQAFTRELLRPQMIAGED